MLIGSRKMNYKIDDKTIRLLQTKQIVEEVQELQQALENEGYELNFDQVFKLYAFNEINKKLEDIIPVE